jgi:hypothetical protein
MWPGGVAAGLSLVGHEDLHLRSNSITYLFTNLIPANFDSATTLGPVDTYRCQNYNRVAGWLCRCGSRVTEPRVAGCNLPGHIITPNTKEVTNSTSVLQTNVFEGFFVGSLTMELYPIQPGVVNAEKPK